MVSPEEAGEKVRTHTHTHTHTHTYTPHTHTPLCALGQETAVQLALPSPPGIRSRGDPRLRHPSAPPLPDGASLSPSALCLLIPTSHPSSRDPALRQHLIRPSPRPLGTSLRDAEVPRPRSAVGTGESQSPLSHSCLKDS